MDAEKEPELVSADGVLPYAFVTGLKIGTGACSAACGCTANKSCCS